MSQDNMSEPTAYHHRPPLDERLARITGLPPGTIRAALEADWPNQAEHDEWLESAPDEEIAGWILSLGLDQAEAEGPLPPEPDDEE